MTTAIPASQQSHEIGRPLPVDRIVDLLLEGMRGHRPVTEICREAGVSPARYYRWRQQFVNAGRAGLLEPEHNRQVLEERIRQLEAENSRLQTHMRIFRDMCVAD